MRARKQPVFRVTAEVRNVSCTAHFDTGDMEVTEVIGVKIDGPMTLYEVRRRDIPFGGLLSSVTIHLGRGQQARCLIAPTMLSAGDNLIVSHPVGVSDLADSGERHPGEPT